MLVIVAGVVGTPPPPSPSPPPVIVVVVGSGDVVWTVIGREWVLFVIGGGDGCCTEVSRATATPWFWWLFFQIMRQLLPRINSCSKETTNPVTLNFIICTMRTVVVVWMGGGGGGGGGWMGVWGLMKTGLYVSRVCVNVWGSVKAVCVVVWVGVCMCVCVGVLV